MTLEIRRFYHDTAVLAIQPPSDEAILAHIAGWPGLTNFLTAVRIYNSDNTTNLGRVTDPVTGITRAAGGQYISLSNEIKMASNRWQSSDRQADGTWGVPFPSFKYLEHEMGHAMADFLSNRSAIWSTTAGE